MASTVLSIFGVNDDDDENETPKQGLFMGPFNPLAAVQNKIAGLKQAVGGAGLVALLGLSVLGLVRRRLNTNLLAGLEAKKAEIERSRRLEDARRELAGPLLVAAQALDSRIEEILQPNGFFEENFQDKTEAAVMSTIYLMCKFFHFRWRLHDCLQYESVSGKDHWQFAVDAVLSDINKAFCDKSRKYAVFSDQSEAFVSFAKASSEPGRISNRTCVEPESVIGQALDIVQQTQYPFRLLKEERDAIGEMMMATHSSNERTGRCLGYTEFVQRMRQMLQTGIKGPEHAWQPYFLPIWVSVVRYAHLITTPAETRTMDAIREMIRIRLRLVAVRNELLNLIAVLTRSPLDSWFRKEKNVYSEKTRQLRSKGVRMWALVASRVPELAKAAKAEEAAKSRHLKSA